MTSFDFLSGFNNIDPKFILDAIDLMQTVEASDAEKEIMNMENYTIHKKRTVRRSVLVAAAVIALLCAMCVGAYAVNLFGIRDAVMGSQIVSDHYVDGEYAGKKLDDGMTISEFSTFVGGLSYTTGVIFYIWEKLYYHHAIWHIFVMLGSAGHYMALINS